MRLLLAILLASPVVLPAQSKYDLTGKPDAALQESFTQVAGVRELPGNRAIVTDQAERAVYMVDFSSGSRRLIGRQGDGPAEYRFPMAPFPAADNATWMLDATRRVVHVVSPDGSFRPSLSPPYGAVPGGLLSARGVDARGNIYFEGNSFNSETGGFTDSVAVIRWNPAANQTRIVAKVWSGGRVTIQRQGSPASMARSILPFPHFDAWTLHGRLSATRAGESGSAGVTVRLIEPGDMTCTIRKARTSDRLRCLYSRALSDSERATRTSREQIPPMIRCIWNGTV